MTRRPAELWLAMMVEDSARVRHTRVNSPFWLVLPEETEEARRSLWREAKRRLEGGKPAMNPEMKQWCSATILRFASDSKA